MKTTCWHRDDQISASYAIGAQLKWCINYTCCRSCNIELIFCQKSWVFCSFTANEQVIWSATTTGDGQFAFPFSDDMWSSSRLDGC